jgi:heme/copper-type cytochrome/quinol oxidase subunit 4
MSNPTEIIKTIWPIVVIQLAVQIYALFDIYKRKGTKNLSSLIWVIIIVFGEIIGAILYLLFGKKED